MYLLAKQSTFTEVFLRVHYAENTVNSSWQYMYTCYCWHSRKFQNFYDHIFPSTIYCLFIMKNLLGNIFAMAPYSSCNPIIF